MLPSHKVNNKAEQRGLRSWCPAVTSAPHVQGPSAPPLTCPSFPGCSSSTLAFCWPPCSAGCCQPVQCPPPPGTAEPALEIWHLGGSSNNPPRVCCFPALTPRGPKQGCVTNTGETAELSSLLRALPVLICKRLEMQEKVLAVGAVTYWVYPVLNPCLHENCLSSNHPPHVSSAS